VMRHAVAGCLQAMPGSALVFAPHSNSFDRMVPGSHAPTGVSWAYENRTSSIRIPSGSHKARRIEHRVSGGDVNPYLMLAAVLGAAINGIEDGIEPPAPITGNAYAADLPQIPADWSSAIDAFQNDPAVARIFAPELVRNFVMTKRQELHYMQELTAQEQVEIYLDTV
jgi:glutamine synthetase